jgi:DNA-binding NtrC family response regulator
MPRQGLQLPVLPDILLRGDRSVQACVHIVDDDASFRKAMERRLTKAGYEVATYASAQPLLDSLPSESVPSCLLLDVRIPELSGPELQERLSELGSTLPIIFLTGHRARSQPQQAAAMPARSSWPDTAAMADIFRS